MVGMFDFSKWAELRDDIAIAAMAETMRSYPTTPAAEVADTSYAMADAMMFARYRGVHQDEEARRQKEFLERGYWAEKLSKRTNVNPSGLADITIGNVQCEYGVVRRSKNDNGGECGCG